MAKVKQRPKLLEAEWLKMSRSDLIRHQNAGTRKILRAVFYAGASATMAVMDRATSDGVSNTKGADLVEGICTELIEFGDQIKREMES